MRTKKKSGRVLPCYDQDGIAIYHGDCFELLGSIPVCDHVITDPPYDLKTHEGARYGFRETSSKIDFEPLEDVERLTDLLLTKAERWVLAFCSLEMFGRYSAGAGACWVRSGIWVRPNGVPQFTGDRPGQPAEGIAIMHGKSQAKRWNGKGKHGIWYANISQQGRVHQTEKPIDLMRQLILDFTDEGDVVLDPFMGSGTTLRACKDLGRYAIGIERERSHIKTAIEKLTQPTPVGKTTARGTLAVSIREIMNYSEPTGLKGV